MTAIDMVFLISNVLNISVDAALAIFFVFFFAYCIGLSYFISILLGTGHYLYKSTKRFLKLHVQKKKP